MGKCTIGAGPPARYHWSSYHITPTASIPHVPPSSPHADGAGSQALEGWKASRPFDADAAKQPAITEPGGAKMVNGEW